MKRFYWLISLVAILASLVVFIVPFLFIILTAVKDRTEASLLNFSWPTQWHVAENFWAVLSARDFMLLTAFVNSTLLTIGSVTLLVVLAAMVGFVLDRRTSRWSNMVQFFAMIGLMFPPAVVPTIWVMQGLGIFKTLPGMVFIEVAYGLPFSILLYRAFISTIPRELDEAAIIDGAKPLSLFFRIILPLLKPVTVTNIVVQSVAIFNDFTNPLYYLPGKENVTVQMTLYNFMSIYNTSYNLLFMNILIITIPPFIILLFFNGQIVSGMTAGAMKG